MKTTLSRFESLNKTQKKKGRIDLKTWPWIVDEKNRGTIGLHTEMVVMNATNDPKFNNRHKVTYFVTENGSLFAGNNTVAIFRIKSLTPEFKAFFNQTNSDMQMDPNSPNTAGEVNESANLGEDTGAGATEEGASEENGGLAD